MKMTTCRVVLAVLGLGLCSELLAGEQQDYPKVVFCGPGAGKQPTTHDEYLSLVVEGSIIFYEKSPVPANEVVDLVNHLLKAKNVTYIGLYPREGTKYGDVVRAVDLLRGTNAKNIGVSMVELKPGREP